MVYFKHSYKNLLLNLKTIHSVHHYRCLWTFKILFLMKSKYLVKNMFRRKLLAFEYYKSFLEISLRLSTIKLGQRIYSQLLLKKTCKSDYSGMFWHILFINWTLLVTAEQIVCICWEWARWQWKNAHGYLGTANKKWRKKKTWKRKCPTLIETFFPTWWTSSNLLL